MYLKNSDRGRKLESIPLSAKTATDRIVKMSARVTDQQVEDIKSVSTI